MAGRLFKDKTQDEQAQTLSVFMPSGKAFMAAQIDDSKLRALINGLAVEQWRSENLMNDITYEHQIDQTTLLIEEWERALGIPDQCFKTDGMLEVRRQQVIAKLAAGIQTAEDFIAFALRLGYTIKTTPGRDLGLFPFTGKFPIMFFDRPQTARYYMRITLVTEVYPNVFPLGFPLPFGPQFGASLTCLLYKLIPANVSLLFDFEIEDQGYIISEDGLSPLETEDELYILSPE
jgi:hypothetical protein